MTRHFVYFYLGGLAGLGLAVLIGTQVTVSDTAGMVLGGSLTLVGFVVGSLTELRRR